MMPVTPTYPNLLESSLMLVRRKIHSQPSVTSTSGFDCSSAFETSGFRIRKPECRHFDFRLRFQISDFSRSEREIEIETSISISGFDFRAAS